MTDKQFDRVEEKLQSLPKPSLPHKKKEAIRSHLMEELRFDSPINRRVQSSKRLFINLAGVVVFALLAFFIFSSIQGNLSMNSGKQPSTSDNAFSIHGVPYKLEDHEQYKGSYIGDNNAVGSILAGLPGSNFRKTIELQTKEQPYGLKVNYGLNNENNVSESDYNEYWSDENKILLYNATVLFMVIDNLNTIDFYLETSVNEVDHSHITRTQIEALYGHDVKDYIGKPELWRKEVLTLLRSNEIDNIHLTQ